MSERRVLFVRGLWNGRVEWVRHDRLTVMDSHPPLRGGPAGTTPEENIPHPATTLYRSERIAMGGVALEVMIPDTASLDDPRLAGDAFAALAGAAGLPVIESLERRRGIDGATAAGDAARRE